MAAKIPSNHFKYTCLLCEFITNNKNDYNRHLLTYKHLQKLNNDKIKTQKTQAVECSCGKTYAHHSGLLRHKKKCTGEKEKDQGIKLSITEIDNNSSSNNNLIIEVLKQNQEFKELLLEQCKQPFSSSSQTPETNAALIMELLKQNNEFKELLIEQNKTILDLASKAGNTTNNNNNTTNNNNQQFNLHIFLNEKCKDAMNITDFTENIKVQLTDLEAFGTHGYCEGITRVFMRCLNELDICKRPIHCSDLKREIMYVKDKDTWEKDDDRKHIKKVIDKIERKNHLTIPAWQQANPEFNQYDSKVNDVYNKMLIEAMGGETKEENEKNYSKITRCIAKGTIITKNP